LTPRYPETQHGRVNQELKRLGRLSQSRQEEMKRKEGRDERMLGQPRQPRLEKMKERDDTQQEMVAGMDRKKRNLKREKHHP
jgi:hypothetical protein